ncbi:suppressor of ty [Culex quinquefasciatus]|uniref:Suppressor of ty n=1 Tax=Culex quinquefasciatus TaxID=7176 RepID=B0X1S7_CULQU|nr:suppressor of ty [Culex quinquefasciatus]|eukprot:XP_001863599.1 suppressor of ty [Culex quinquefasciatus]
MAEETHRKMKILAGRKQQIHGHQKEVLINALLTPFQKGPHVAMKAFINQEMHLLVAKQVMIKKPAKNPPASLKDQRHLNSLQHWEIQRLSGMSK